MSRSPWFKPFEPRRLGRSALDANAGLAVPRPAATAMEMALLADDTRANGGLGSCSFLDFCYAADTLSAVIGLAVALLGLALAAQNTKRGNEAAFGFWKGMTLEEANRAAPLREVVRSQPYLLQTSNPPRPDSTFAFYWLRIGPSVGACGVTAFTKEKRQNSKDFIDTAADILNIVSGRYGPPSEVTSKYAFTWKDPQGPGTRIQLAWAIEEWRRLYHGRLRL